jgi:hypothetical protein
MRAESAPTAKFESLWLPPVTDEGALPVLAADGQFCFVQTKDEVYVFHEGRWQAVRSVGS